jgi:carboxyl-terminal processing protease
LLRHRLTRRGITLSAALLAPALVQGAGAPAPLTVRTIKAALAYTAGAPGAAAGATALAEGVLKGMLMNRLKIAAAVLLVLGTLTGAGALVRPTLAAWPGAATRPEPEAAPPREAPAADKDAAGAKEVAPEVSQLARRLWDIMGLVQAHHPEPPSRQAMILAAARALLKAAKAEPADDLERRAARATTREQLATLLREVWPRGEGTPPADQLASAAIDGLFSTVPGQGVCMPADAVRVTEQISANRYVGIGIQIGIDAKEKMPQIIIPFRRGPAHRAGIKPGDLIVEVEGKSTRGEPLTKVVDWLRGEEATTFTMAVRTPGEEKARVLKITRTVVPFETVQGYRRASEDSWDFRTAADGPVGYVLVNALRSSTPHELRQVERRLRAEGVRALVLDLRPCGAGSDLHNGALTASALLDGGLMWRVVEPDKPPQECRAGRECLFRDWPLAVLIDERLDSAAGAVAAALQDNGRAVLVGEMTRNGGFVNSLLPLPDGQGAVSFRTGRLQRAAKGRGWPVEPDQPVPLTKKQREALGEWFRQKDRSEQPGGPADKPPEDPQLDKAVELLRAALKKADEGR